MIMNKKLFAVSSAIAAAAVLVGCTTNSASSGSDSIAVTNTDTECNLSTKSSPGGTVVFDVKNAGSKVTEFYLLASDGLRIVGEVENIGPGITRSLVVRASEGEYFTVCKPGMKGDGIRAAFTVTQGDVVAVDEDFAELLTVATDQYALYVKQQSEELVVKTKEFAELYINGQDDKARSLYPIARTHWERIEPVAESFGDLDPRLDLREADLEEDQKWTGWHRIEKDLWPQKDGASYVALTATERQQLADQLVADTEELNSRVLKLTFDPTQLGNGAKELLDEVATGKVTGEEEIWSGTDLWDFQANLDGARIAFEVLEPALRQKDAALADTLTERFASVQTALDLHKSGDGFVLYSTLTESQVQELARVVDALSEPLSQLTAAVVL